MSVTSLPQNVECRQAATSHVLGGAVVHARERTLVTRVMNAVVIHVQPHLVDRVAHTDHVLGAEAVAKVGHRLLATRQPLPHVLWDLAGHGSCLSAGQEQGMRGGMGCFEMGCGGMELHQVGWGGLGWGC